MQGSLRTWILAAFSVALVAFVAALLVGLVKVRGVERELGRVQDLWLPLSEKVLALQTRYPEEDVDADLKQPERTRNSMLEIRDVRMQVFREQLAGLQRDASEDLHAPSVDPATSAHLKNLVDALALLTEPSHAYPSLLQAVLRPASGTTDAQAEQAREAFATNDRRINDAIDGARRAVDEGLRDDAAAAEAKARGTLVALAALAAIATAFGLAAMGLVGRALSPIADLIAGVKRISAGDFSRRVAVSGGGEVALLAGEFNAMATSLLSRDERLKALSAYNENVVESVRVGILVADASGVVTVMNRAAEEIWGLARVEVVGKPLASLAVLAPFRDRIEPVRAGGPSVRVGATRLPNDRIVEVAATPFVEDGKANGVVVAVEDVSERVRVEQALLRSERLAAIGRMSSQITHEVRNPLNSLSLNVEMLEEELGLSGGQRPPDAEAAGSAKRDQGRTNGKDPEAKALLQAIAKEIGRLEQITEGYLSFARLPKPSLAREQVNGLVDGLLDFLRGETEVAGVAISKELAGNLPEVLADENQLRQALLNVVRNALEAMRERKKGGKLRVSTRAAGGDVELTFADDGPGIEPKDLARIFDPFYSTKKEGTGLGLPLTQQIIEEHGGSIACASEPGRGTTFTIRLPAA